MKNISKFLFIMIVVSTTLIGSCKKQTRCGCDGDIISNFLAEPVLIHYDEEAKSAEFSYEYAPYSRYYFCNPSEVMDQLVKFDQGERVLITCDLYYECNYMMQASNSPYGSIYRAYMVDVVLVESSIYGNN